MNISILCKILEALSVVTVLTPTTLELKQTLELIIKDPAAANQLNQLIGQAVCCNWETFEGVGQFVAACLTQGNAANIPDALSQFNSMAVKVAQ